MLALHDALLVLLLVARGAAAYCSAPEDCSLNGACVGSSTFQGPHHCVCNQGWKGETCALLDRRPAPSRSAAGVWGMPLNGRPNVTSWGGNVLLDNATGHHHLYVTEIAGPNGSSCGLVSWGSHSTVIHAVSTSGLGGPYTKASVAVGHEGHNPQAVRVGSKWVLFHIGGGSAPGTPVSPCPAPPPAGCHSFHSEGSCPTKRCEWKGDACVDPPPPPLPPTPPALCAKLAAAKGYTCTGDTCGGPSGRLSSSHNCGAYLTVPTLKCTDDCAQQMAALCDKDSKCHSFSLMNKVSGSGAMHSQTFSGGKSCLRRNRDWSTWVKSNSSSSGGSEESPRYTGSEIHVSDSPAGPFMPLKTTYSGCNNPSPYVMKNGTILVLCTWKIIAAEKLEGPWRSVIDLRISPSTRMGVAGNWEDPFLWQDVTGMWHALSHTYTHQPGGPGVQNSISGHLFARSVEGPWHVSPIEPYDSVVAYADDNTTETFSTMERPKLMFDGTGNPIAITNGVSPVFPCGTCKGFGDAPKLGGCCWCKVTPGQDWTYTVMQPVGGW